MRLFWVKIVSELTGVNVAEDIGLASDSTLVQAPKLKVTGIASMGNKKRDLKFMVLMSKFAIKASVC